jgi:hypothetical protein
MPLPKKTIRVLPNPWAFIHHELGPQGHCHEDTGGRGTDPRYIGADYDRESTKLVHDYESKPNETRLNIHVQAWEFPVLEASLLKPAKGFEDGIELAKTAYYLDRLRDGDLIPADERSGEHGARFASLAEAKAAGIASFEANYGPGTFAEAFPAFSDAVTVAATPSAKAARASRETPAAESGAAQ